MISMCLLICPMNNFVALSYSDQNHWFAQRLLQDTAPMIINNINLILINWPFYIWGRDP